MPIILICHLITLRLMVRRKLQLSISMSEFSLLDALLLVSGVCLGLQDYLAVSMKLYVSVQ